MGPGGNAPGGPPMIARRLALLMALVLLPPAGVAQDKAPAATEPNPLSAVMQVRARILPDARSRETLGTRREGSGVLVREGYVLTIGYLVIEAEAIEVTGADGKSVPATLAGYDHASGFGLLRLLAPLDGRPLPLGDSGKVQERDRAIVASFGGPERVSPVYVVSRRQFSGSWEYLLESAIFTYPPVPEWSGAALINASGQLLGIGSLIVGDSTGLGLQAPGNMFVPADLLAPIVEDLIASGRPKGPARPWLGMNTEELRGRLLVTRVSPGGPADRAGVREGDLLVGVGAEDVTSLADFYRKLWGRGPAGVEVPLRVLQGREVRELKAQSIDRVEYFRAKPSY